MILLSNFVHKFIKSSIYKQQKPQQNPQQKATKKPQQTTTGMSQKMGHVACIFLCIRCLYVFWLYFRWRLDISSNLEKKYEIVNIFFEFLTRSENKVVYLQKKNRYTQRSDPNPHSSCQRYIVPNVVLSCRKPPNTAISAVRSFQNICLHPAQRIHCRERQLCRHQPLSRIPHLL